MTSPERNLQDRYGVSNSPSNKRLIQGLCIAASVLFVALVLWVTWVFISGNQVKASTVSYEHLSESEIEVKFSLNVQPGTAVSCGVEAFNDSRGQVGFTVAHIPPQSERLTVHKIVVTTQQKAVSGAVKTCEVAR